MTDLSPRTSDVNGPPRWTGVLSWPVLVPLVVGLIAGAATTYALTGSRGAATLVQGTVAGIASDSPDGEVKAIAFRFDGHHYGTPGEGESVPVVADVRWTDAAGHGYGGSRPSCLADGTYGQRVELGVVEVRGVGDWGGPLVVWVHCLA